MPLSGYEVLGLTKTASKEDVKKRYRKLALSYHPDKNSDPKSKERFLLITEAYKTILAGKTYIGQKEVLPNKPSHSPKETLEERKKRAHAYAAYAQRKHKAELAQFKQSSIAVLSRKLSFIYLLIGLFIIGDYSFTKNTAYTLNKIYRHPSNINLINLQIKKNNNIRTIELPYDDIKRAPMQNFVLLQESPWTHVVHNASFILASGKIYAINNYRSIYKAFLLMIIIFLGPFISIYLPINKGYYYGLIYARIFFPIICLILILIFYLS